MNSVLQQMLMANTGMPTPGRRSKGYGASPFGPGGRKPIHHMNFLLGGMGRHGMMGSPLAAGRYPYPQHPFPIGLQAMPMRMMGGGMGGAMGSGPGAMCGGGMGPGMLGGGMGWDDLSDAGGGMGGPFLGGLGGGAMMSGGLGGLDSPDAMMGDMWGGMGSGMGGLYPPAMMGMPLGYSPWMHGDPMGVFSGSVLGEDDDSGVWDAEEDAEGSDPFELYYRAMKKSQMKNKGPCRFGRPSSMF